MPDNRKYSDRREYNIKAVAKRRKKLKELALDLKGNKCYFCGYAKCTRALNFHHLNPSKKDFGLAQKGWTRSWAKIKEELEKCILVCANCHMEIHAGLLQLPQAIEVEKRGELLETLRGNQQPSSLT
jgi:transcription elongation factor Elf1